MLSDHLRRLLLPHRPKRFLAWQIDITTKCPLACRMCIRRGLPDWSEEEMSLADFIRLVPYFDDVETVILQGWGEPLLHPDLVPIIRAAKGLRHPPAVGFVTSGTGLNEQLASGLIDAGLDFIGFSFAGSTAGTHASIRAGSDYGELVNAVGTLQRLKERKRSGRPRLHMVYLLLRDNLRDLPDLPRLARDLGIGEIVLTNLIHVTTGWQDEQKIFSCEGLGDAANAIEDAEKAGRARGVQVRRPSFSPRTIDVCEEDPLHTLYVSPQGDVSPCVYLHPPTGREFTRIFCGTTVQVHRVSFGNVLREPVRDIWEREGYAAFRKQLADRTRARGPLAALFHAGGAAPGHPARPEPPPPCRTCHKMLGL